jgi:hypothetical protein
MTERRQGMVDHSPVSCSAVTAALDRQTAAIDRNTRAVYVLAALQALKEGADNAAQQWAQRGMLLYIQGENE